MGVRVVVREVLREVWVWSHLVVVVVGVSHSSHSTLTIMSLPRYPGVVREAAGLKAGLVATM